MDFFLFPSTIFFNANFDDRRDRAEGPLFMTKLRAESFGKGGGGWGLERKTP